MYYINNKTNKIISAVKLIGGNYVVETDNGFMPMSKDVFEEYHSLVSMDELKEKIQAIREIRDVQAVPGTIDQGDYMIGLYNGLELALAILEDREPEFKVCEPVEARLAAETADINKVIEEEENKYFG